MLDIAAIFWGIVAALVLNFLVGAVLGLGVLIDAIKPGDPDHEEPSDEELDAVFEAEMHNPVSMAQMAILSLVATAVSGAVTAWLAPQAPYLHAGIVGATGLVFGIVMEWRNPTLPFVINALFAVLIIPATLLGAWIAT